nr:cytochrome b [Matsucoccus matsumurae]
MMMKLMNKLINIPIPLNISLFWNLGFLLSINMFIQILLGLFLSINYINNNVFDNIFNIYYNMNYGWMLRIMHSNMSSFIFILIYMHILRNIYYNNFKNLMMWMSGMMMLIMLMLIAFSGYILPWSQMSYWGAMVITNLLSTIPIIGNKMMMLLWGNFNINLLTLNRFFTIHFIFPMILMLLIIIHLNILHLNKSSNPMGILNKIDLIKLNPYFMMKDLIMMIFFMLIFMNMNLIFPFMLNNTDNFIKMSYLSTPNHIEPEWYFLFFYSILRSINNKLGGFIMMIMSLFMLLIMPIMYNQNFQSLKFYYINKFFFWLMIMILIILTWLGMMEIEYPYNMLNKIFMMNYFFFFFIYMMMLKMSDLLMK